MTAHRLALGLMAATLAAGADNSVAGLIASVRSGIANHQPDAKLAGALAKIKLDERLDRRVVEELESEGAGPAATAELERLRESSESKAEPRTPLPFANPPVPGAAKPKPRWRARGPMRRVTRAACRISSAMRWSTGSKACRYTDPGRRRTNLRCRFASPRGRKTTS